MRNFLKKSEVESLLKNIETIDNLGEASLARAVLMVSLEDSVEKADPEYSHKEGSDLYPKYYYKDQNGNLIRYNNAPEGHEDYDDSFGEALPSQDMTPENAPQFFTVDGRRLTRAPYTGSDVEWNPNYHKNDPKNLWAGRWVNPATGDHEYTYIDSDIREQSPLAINLQNAQIDTRLPLFRQYIAALYKSKHLKDKTVACILALLDQGRFRVRELMSIRVGEVIGAREEITLGNRKIHADPNLKDQLMRLTSHRNPNEPLWMVPTVESNGDTDYSKMRRIGPHFVVNLLEELGISPEALQTYHASQTYSMEMQRLFGNADISYTCAHTFAMLEVASEMGHKLDGLDDYRPALSALQNAAVDPIVVLTIKQSCNKLGIGNGQDMPNRPIFEAMPHVSMTLAGRTEEEEAFSSWLHNLPLHNFAEEIQQ